jgi:hypothetical protein
MKRASHLPSGHSDRPVTVYKVRAYRPPRTRRAGQRRLGWELLAGLVSLLLLALLAGGLVWVVASGFGRGRWIVPNTSPTPKAGAGSSAVAPTPTVKPGGTGVIRGTLSFPASFLPAQQVCAEPVDVDSATEPVCIPTAESQSEYSLSLPSGSYHVYATVLEPSGNYPPSYRAYFNQFVTCQQNGTVSCSQDLHAKKIVVPVLPNDELSGVNPGDWYNS